MMIPHVEWEGAGASRSGQSGRVLRSAAIAFVVVSHVLDFRASITERGERSECQERIDGVPGINSEPREEKRGSGKDGQELVIGR